MGAVNTTYTFTATDTITSTKMNNIIDQTTMTSDAIIGATLEVASGKLKVRASGITSNELATNSVTNAKITNLSVTTAKVADLNITSAKIADNSIIQSKMSDNSVGTAEIINSNVTASKLSGAQSGTAPVYGIRAWARVGSSGSIIENKGFATISRVSGGTYNLTLSATPTENPCVIVTAHPSSNLDWSAHVIINSTSSFTVKTGWYNSWSNDCPFSIMVLY